MSDGTIRLLIVEDNPAHSRLVLEMLKESSKTVRFDVAMADSLASALDHLRGMNRDVIMLDLGLPDSQGLDTLHSIHSEHPGIPIVVLTVLDDEESAVKALGGGAQDYIVKGRTESAVLVRSIRYAIERKRAEVTLRESGKKYRDLVETMNDVVFTLDLDGGVVDTSPSMKKIIGLSREETVGKSFSDFVHPDDIQRAEEEFLRAIQGIGHPLEIRVTTLDGALRWVRINALLIMKEGEPDNLMCTLSDITDRKHAEEALASSEQFLRNVIEQSPVSLWISDSEGTLVKMNQACRELFGTTDEEAVGKYNLLKDNLIEAQGFMHLVRGVFEKGEIARFTIDYDVRKVEHIKVKGATHRILDVIVSPIKDIHGKITNALVEHIDVTERKKAEEELANETTAATESKQKAEAYFDFMAHDIANILSPVMAYADMLKARPNDQDQVIKFSSKILEQGKRASSLISNLRRLESIERTHPNEIDTIDLRTLFSSLEDEIQGGFPGKEIVISYDIPDIQSMNVKGGEWVENVLRCVYDNAVRYSTRSAVELEIRASMLQQEGKGPCWQIEVSDHGPGIPDNVKGHFNEEMSLKEREFKGVASSLPFCVSMIKCLGGELLVSDRVPGDHNQGTRVTIRLPKGE